MKKIAITLFLCAFSMTTYCQSMSVEIAKVLADNNLKQYSNRNRTIEKIDSVLIGNTTCMYLIVFSSGEWCYVASDIRSTPIIAYGFSDDILNDTPPAFTYLLNLHAEHIVNLHDDTNTFVNSEWHRLFNIDRAIPNAVCHIDNGLLNTTGRGLMVWKQGKSNSGSCTHSYNKYCPVGLEFLGCTCGHAPVGCGAVALGMTMWYWQWPKQLPWEFMPPRLDDFTPDEHADFVAEFLSYCGVTTHMSYLCTGSSTLMDNIVSALHNEGYESATKYKESDWQHWAWKCLIESEIDNNRPVIFYGQPSGINFWEGHYFIIDGYDNSPDRKYHINFGHGASEAWCSLDYINEVINGDTSFYTYENHVIVGISPKYDEGVINHLHYDEIGKGTWRAEYAYDRISIPANGDRLIVEDGGQLYMEAGNEMVLNPGFEAQYGSNVQLQINKGLLDQMEIAWNIPSCSVAVNGLFQIVTKNADSWEFTVRPNSSSITFQSAGVIHESTTVIWNPVQASVGEYSAKLVLKNSYGRKQIINFNINVTFSGCRETTDSSDNCSNVETLHHEISSFKNKDSTLYPNPTSGELTAKVDGELEAVVILDVNGNPQGGWDFVSITDEWITLNVRRLKAGAYILVVRHSNGDIETGRFVKQ